MTGQARYVILEHASARGRHWDLMLESGPALRTWALSEAPAAGRPVAAARLVDHRLAYLDHQGPVSGDRGSVARWDEGTYELVAETPVELELQFAGRRLQGRAALRQVAKEAWEFLLR